jgi:hypothetical protein
MTHEMRAFTNQSDRAVQLGIDVTVAALAADRQ